MTEPDTSPSYDDVPESDVATVLQVPLLWAPPSSAAPDRSGGRAQRRQAGRHRAPTVKSASPYRRWSTSTRPTQLNHHVVAAARVGLLSASLVLVVFAVVLLGLAVWLPWGVPLVGTPAPKHSKNRLEHDGDVEGQRPVLDVEQIEAYRLVPGEV